MRDKNYSTNGLAAVETQGNYPRGVGLGPINNNPTGARPDERHMAGNTPKARSLSRGGSTEQPQ